MDRLLKEFKWRLSRRPYVDASKPAFKEIHENMTVLSNSLIFLVDSCGLSAIEAASELSKKLRMALKNKEITKKEYRMLEEYLMITDDITNAFMKMSEEVTKYSDQIRELSESCSNLPPSGNTR